MVKLLSPFFQENVAVRRIIVPSGACNDKPALLNLQRGEFGSDYEKDESCQWRIEVDDDQVGLF